MMKLHSSFALLGILGLAKPSATTSPAPSVERIRELFSVWETGEGLDFIDNVLTPGCKFVVPGSHRFAGVYDREGIKAVELEVFKMFQVPETIEIGRIFRDEEGDWASISMASKNGSLLKNGKWTISTNVLSAIDTVHRKTV
jgi:hypothetical protein